MVLDPPEGTRSLFSPSTRYAQIRRVIAQRLHLVGPLRQRALRVPLGLHHPVWVDDPDFELDDHLSRASLPSPGGRAELDAFVAAAMSRPLDPDRPLWEMYVVEGLDRGRTALIAKVHHAILDGVSGASMLAAFLDLNPGRGSWPLPDGALGSGAAPGQRADAALCRGVDVAPARPGRSTTLDAGVEAIADLGMHNRELAEPGRVAAAGLLLGAPRTSFNGAVSNRKRFSSLSIPLNDAKLVRRALRGHGERRDPGRGGRRVAPPAAARGERSRAAGGHGAGVDPPRRWARADALGNQISAMLVSLATDIDDPVQRLGAIARSTRVAKEQEQLHRGRLVGDLAQIAAPGLVSRLARAVAGTKLFDRVRPPFNVMVSGIKGPDFPLFCAGSRVVGHVSCRPDSRGRGVERDHLLLSRPTPVRAAGLPQAPPRARRPGRLGR